MNALVAACAGAAGTLLYWRIAVAAAERRDVKIGSLPAWLVAGAAVVAGGAAFVGFPAAPVAAGAGAAVAGLVDARTGFLFDPLTGSIALVSFAFAGANGSLADGLRGAGAGGGMLLLLHVLTRGRGLGLGDVKLGAALGLALGTAAALTALGLAFVFGGSYGTWLLVSKRATGGHAIRFGPFIAAGTLATVLEPLGFHP